MTPDELAEIREGYWGRPGSNRESQIRSLFTHIDAQAAQISFLDSRCNDLLEANEALKHEFMESNVLDLKRQIIELSDSAVREESKKDEQIEALKDKLAEERAKILMAGEDEVAEAWEYLKDNPNFINDAYQQLKADPDLQKAGVVWDRPTPRAARRKAGSPGRYAKETEDVEMDSRTDDILAQAEVLLKNQPKWRILASEDAEDVKSLIELMPQLLAEAKRQKALNPFQVDVSTAMRLGDNEFVYGDKKSLDLCENRIRDRDAWKAKAIGERAKALQSRLASLEEVAKDPCRLSGVYGEIHEIRQELREMVAPLAAEIERLRSENNRINKLREAEINQAGAAERVYLEVMMVKDARIKELGADRIAYRNLGSRIEDLETYIERLEAAFLDHLAARLYYEHYPGVSDAYSWHDYPEDACHSMPKEEFRKKAREALEEIKNGMEN